MYLNLISEIKSIHCINYVSTSIPNVYRLLWIILIIISISLNLIYFGNELSEYTKYETKLKILKQMTVPDRASLAYCNLMQLNHDYFDGFIPSHDSLYYQIRQLTINHKSVFINNINTKCESNCSLHDYIYKLHDEYRISLSAYYKLYNNTLNTTKWSDYYKYVLDTQFNFTLYQNDQFKVIDDDNDNFMVKFYNRGYFQALSCVTVRICKQLNKQIKTVTRNASHYQSNYFLNNNNNNNNNHAFESNLMFNNKNIKAN